MAEDASAPKEPLDVKRVHYLVRLMKQYDLTALDLSDSTVQIRLRRRGSDAPSSKAAPSPRSSDLGPPSAVGADASLEAVSESVLTSVSAAPKTIVIESPMVGTFYRGAQPGSPPFVEEGDPVVPGQTLCILEAMKLMNEVKAEIEAVVRRVYVENAQPVEYGQPLYGIRPSRKR